MNFTYIIPFKYSDDRLITLTKVLSNVRSFGCEVIVIEQGEESILPTKNVLQNEKYIFINNPLPFNKAWSLNVAWKEATNDVIVFGDADNMISQENLLKSFDELKEYDFVSPHNKLIDLEPHENDFENEKIFEIKRHFRGEFDHQKMPLCGGTTIFKKEALETNGMNTLQAVTYQIINGKNGMPAFSGRLKEEDIEEVANYILFQSLNNFEN